MRYENAGYFFNERTDGHLSDKNERSRVILEVKPYKRNNEARRREKTLEEHMDTAGLLIYWGGVKRKLKVVERSSSNLSHYQHYIAYV